MPTRPPFQLSQLREIAWAKWDPIDVGGPDHGWPADEYDKYILEAAGRIWHGQSDAQVTAYLVKMETEYMGLDAVPETVPRASATVEAIRAYVDTLPR